MEQDFFKMIEPWEDGSASISCFHVDSFLLSMSRVGLQTQHHLTMKEIIALRDILTEAISAPLKDDDEKLSKIIIGS